MIKDFSFFIWNDSVCFLLKKAVAIPLKNSRKRKNNVFLRGNCFTENVFFFWLSSYYYRRKKGREFDFSAQKISYL